MYEFHGTQKSTGLYERASQVIPGGTHLYGKRSELHAPGVWPAYIARAEGGHFWDVDGNEFIDYNLGAGPVMLGHAFPPVVEAVQRQLPRGQIYATSSPLEIELADLVIGMVPCAEMVRFARTGGEACAVAVRIARSYSHRDKVLFCGYHGWHDWYISANLADGNTLNNHLLPGIDPLGVPRALTGTAIPFEYNNIASLQAALEANRGEVACIVIEPARTFQPENNFLQQVRRLADSYGVVLIFDETVTGFRYSRGGAQEYFGVIPDMGIFGKAMGNGFALTCVAGKREVMMACRDSFISSCFWGETTSLAAGIASLTFIRDNPVIERIWQTGKALIDGVSRAAEEMGVPLVFLGKPCNPFVRFRLEDATLARGIATLWEQEQLRRGVCAGGLFYICYSHTQEDVERTVAVCTEALQVVRRALDAGDASRFLLAGEKKDGFKRLV
jgi:glutamate-1-semialdehyde 2,1-aminomutase